MTRGFGQMLLIGGLLWWARLGGGLAISRLRSGTRLLFPLLWIARFALLAWLWTLTITRLTLTRRLVAIAGACGAWPAIASLSLWRAWRARRFLGDVGGRYKAVYRHFRNLALDQSLNVSEIR